MFRKIAAVAAGLATWVIVASILDRLLRASWPDYAAALPSMQFTLQMMAARLTEGAIATFAAGYVCGWIAPRAWLFASAQAALLLMMFLPVHYQLWAKFPVWYHVTFLISLAVLTLLGAAAASRERGGASG